MFFRAALRVLPGGLAGALYMTASVADPLMGFDAETLRLRGIDPQLAVYLGESARFTAGQHPVRLTVNGQPHGRVDALFDATGALCFDPGLIAAAGLQGHSREEDCQAFTSRYPETQIELRPGSGEIELWVPAAAVVAATPVLGDFSVGGVAGLLNYDLQGLFTRFDDQRSQFWSANTEAGFNAGDWVVRSRQLYANSNGHSRSEHLEAYAQRTFAAQQAVLQLGQINLFNPVLSGARIQGAQWASEPALLQQQGGASLSGIAATQARVEVHQSGVLIYSTVVPAGPFELGAISQLDSRRDVQLTVIEADGERRTVTVLSSSLGASLPASGFSFGAGQVRDAGGAQNDPWVLSAGGSLPLTATASVSGGAMLAADYQALGSGLSAAPWAGARWQGVLQSSRAQRAGTSGLQGSASLQQALGSQWSAQFSYAQQTAGHRELIDTVLRDQSLLASRYRYQYTFGLGWSHVRVGSLNAGYSHSTLFDTRQSGRAYAAWGQQWGPASLALNAEWQIQGDGGLGNALYLSASLPIGERRRVRASARASGGRERYGLALQEQVNERVAYRIGGERSSHAGALDVSGGLSLLPGATQLDLGYASYGQGNQSYNLGARGGLVAHGDGITLSAYPVQDTFAVLSVGDVPDVRVETPGGTVWTDRHGRAVVAQLSPYGRSTVEVATTSLPRNVDLHQGAAQIQAGRGAVPMLQFDTLITRRALLRAVDEAARPLPRGALVLGDDDALVTLVQDEGLIFVPDVLGQPRLKVQIEGRPACELEFELPAQADPEAYFESAPALCRAS